MKLNQEFGVYLNVLAQISSLLINSVIFLHFYTFSSYDKEENGLCISGWVWWVWDPSSSQEIKTSEQYATGWSANIFILEVILEVILGH